MRKACYEGYILCVDTGSFMTQFETAPEMVRLPVAQNPPGFHAGRLCKELDIDFLFSSDYNHTRKLQSFEYDYYGVVIYVHRKGRRA